MSESLRPPGPFDPHAISVEEERMALATDTSGLDSADAGEFDPDTTEVVTADNRRATVTALAANLKVGEYVACFCPFHPNTDSPSASVRVTQPGTPHLHCFSDSCNRTYWPPRRWPPLVPFGGSDLPEFPVDTFPSWVGEYVDAVAEFTQTPTDLGAMLALSALAVATGRKFVVEPKPGWTEPLCLFTATAMPPGSRKSAVFADVTRPIRDHERALVAVAEKDIATKAAEQALLKEQLRQQEAEAAKADAASQARLVTEATAIRVRIIDAEPPPRPRLLADDVTSEALAGLLATHGGRMAVMSAEGGIFEIMAGRYSASGAASFDVYLKGHAGDELRVDRRSRPPEFVGSPCLTVALTVQPLVISSLADKPGFRGRGLLARFLYALPDGLVGRRRTDAPPVPQALTARYARRLTRLLTLPLPTDPTPLTFDREASKGLMDFWARLEPRLAPGSGLDGVCDWASKLWGAVPRIAGLLHLAEHLDDQQTPTTIPVGPVNAAVRMAEEHLIPHALAAFDLMAADAGIEDAKHVHWWLRHAKPTTFTKREAHKANEGRFRRVAALEAALAILAERGYVRRVPSPHKEGPGRPSEVFEVNPAALADRIDKIDKRVAVRTASGDSVDSVDFVEASTANGTERSDVPQVAATATAPGVEIPAPSDAVAAMSSVGVPFTPSITSEPKPTEVTEQKTPWPPSWGPFGFPPDEDDGTPEWKEAKEAEKRAAALLE